MTPTVPDGPDTELIRAAEELLAAERGTRADVVELADHVRLAHAVQAMHDLCERRARLRRTDGPDTELAAAIAYFENVDDLRAEMRFYEAWGHAATIVRAVLARPAAGRDLTAQDVDEAVMASTDRNGEALQSIADHLTRIARPAVARTDRQPPADEPRRCPMDGEPLMAMDAHRDGVTFYRHTDGHGHLDARAELSSAPADDTATRQEGGDMPLQGKRLSGWNYRVVRQTHEGETLYGIHEAYYEPLGWTAEPVAPVAESVAELRDVLARMAVAPELEVVDGGEVDAPAADTAAPDMPAIVAGVERSYVEALNAVLAAPGGSDDVDRWRGQAEAYRTVAEQLRRDHGMPRVEYGSGEWRRTHGVQPVRGSQPEAES